MARRRELKSIASGMAARCVSRNNDIGGYWAMGIIYSIAIDRAIDVISIDIMADGSLCSALKDFRQSFREHLGSLHHPLSRFISACIVDFEFEPSSVSNIRGQKAQANCTVHIIDDLALCRSASAMTFCYPHDPRFELKSTRAQ